MLYLLDEAQSAGAALARLIGVTDLPAAAVSGDAAYAGRRLGLADPACGSATRTGRRCCTGSTWRWPRASGWRWSAPPAPARPPSARSSPAYVSRGRGRSGSAASPLAELADLRRHVVLVTQEVHVFAGTVADNLRLARPEADDAELRAALEQVGVDLDLDAVVGHGADELSATHAQQLALTRLVLADPDVAILDEATAEAGSAGARVLEAAAEPALRGRTAIVIAHRLTQAVDADRVVVMEKGRVVEIGRHADLVRTDGPYARLWSAWTSAR